MPDFSNAPPAESSSHNFDLVRTPPSGKLTACITSLDLLGCPTHFYRQQTIPCEYPDCPACAEGLPWRWHGYVSIWTAKTHYHQLFEMTAPAAETLVQYRKLNGTLRGCILTAHRISPRTNGRVRINTSKADLTQIVLPDPPNLRLILATLWNLPALKQQVAGTLKDHPRFIPTSLSPLPDDGSTNLDLKIFNEMMAAECKSPNGSHGD